MASRKITFNAGRAQAMYKAGKNVSEIAQAFGYAVGTGNNRVRNALIKAGVYASSRTGQKSKPTVHKSRTIQTKVRRAPHREISLGVPSDPETALLVCLRFVDNESRKLKMDPMAQGTFARRLLGGIATHFGVHDFQARKPLTVLDVEKAQPHVMQMAQA